MRKIAYTLFATILFSCGTATQEEITDETPTAAAVVSEETPEPIEEEELPGFNYDAFDGVVIRKTPARDNANPAEPANGHVAATTLVTPRKGDRMPPMDGDECTMAGYHWYAVSEGGDAPSWISGEDLYLRSNADFTNNMNREEMDFGYKTNGQFYHFDVAASSFEEPADLTDPIFCYEYGFPFMYQEDNPTVFPIIITEEVGELGFIYGSTLDGYLLILFDSDGGGANIDDFIEIEAGVYQMKLSIGYQDGGASATLHIIEKDGQFLLTEIEQVEDRW